MPEGTDWTGSLKNLLDALTELVKVGVEALKKGLQERN
jgi:hypothetical protein